MADNGGMGQPTIPRTPPRTLTRSTRHLLERHLNRLSQAPRLEVVIPRSLRLDTTARHRELLATVSTPSPGWKGAKVIRSVRGLDGAAAESVSHWVYKPALSNNKPVAVWIQESVPFPSR